MTIRRASSKQCDFEVIDYFRHRFARACTLEIENILLS